MERVDLAIQAANDYVFRCYKRSGHDRSVRMEKPSHFSARPVEAVKAAIRPPNVKRLAINRGGRRNLPSEWLLPAQIATFRFESVKRTIGGAHVNGLVHPNR